LQALYWNNNVNLFSENLKRLQAHDPALAKRVMAVKTTETVQVTLAKDGCAVPRVGKISLHSVYRPREEAQRAVSDFAGDEDSESVIYGLGFGYHVQAMLENWPGRVTVVEPSMEIFQAFLSSINLQPFLPRTRFLIAEPAAKILARNDFPSWNIFQHTPSIRISQRYFESLEKGHDLKEFLRAQPLRILVVNPIYGGSLPTARYCASSLKNLGHQVSVAECDKFADGFASLKDMTGNKENANALSRQFMNFMGETVAARAADFQPDLILALAQAPLTPQAIERLKSLKVPVAFWFVEDFRTLPYWKEVASSYDYFFTIQQGEVFGQLESAGAKSVYYLPQGCFPDEQRPLKLSPDERKTYGADLSFMGAAYYNRRQSFPQLLGHDFKIWGTGWDLQSPVGQCVQNENCRVSSKESVKIYNGAKIHLNLHSSTYHEGVNPDGDFVNPRTFEISACGGFQLVDQRSELCDLLLEGGEIATFKSVADLKQKISYYLEHEEERQLIAQKGRERVLAEHTLEHRMTEMLLHIFGDQLESLKQRIAGRKESVENFIEQAGEKTELADYLEQFRGTPEFSLKTITDTIAKGEGALTRTETLMLMVDQLVNEKR
jgi:spore maturation protein CgeB